MPNSSHGTMAKSEKAHIEAEEKQTDAEQCPMEPKHSPNSLISMSRRKRPMPNRFHETKAKSEKDIEAGEILDAAEVHYICFASKLEVQFPQTAPIEGGIFSRYNGTASNLTAR
uniref:Uncharacterized protein n=1 Tax=Fagus sylvatica TaxID=28930 RepID=A0A2N9FCE4_FAGSY